MHHRLKIERMYYDAIISGKKTFEIRVNDRDYQSGDTIEMWATGFPFPPILATIGWVSNYKQTQNHVVFSLLNITQGDLDDYHF
jgi:ASC-1-like (ASCH) protein